MDLPQQIKLAKQTIYEKDIKNVSTYEANILLEETRIPKDFDIYWMSSIFGLF